MTSIIIILDSLEANWPFIKCEIPFLVQNYNQVYLVPLKTNKLSIKIKINNVFLILDLKNYISNNRKKFFKISNFRNIHLFLKEIMEIPLDNHYIYNLKHTFYYYHLSVIIKIWLSKFIKTNKLNYDNCLIYSYWFNFSSIGACFIKRDNPEIKVITRAHGGDLYKERRKGKFFPFRKFCNNHLSAIFFISNSGKYYYLDQYPGMKQKLHVAKLGVPDPGFWSSPSSDGAIRIVSCSTITQVKNIELLVEGLTLISSLYPDISFYWFHFGSGPRISIIQKQLLVTPHNLIYSLFGQTPNENIMNFYRNHPIDVFINTSISEGIPMSIMEAQSCSIPVIAPSVGGITEIVTNDNGYLLSETPTPKEIAEIFEMILLNPKMNYHKRKKSQKDWEENYNSEENFHRFNSLLKKLDLI